MSMKVVLNRGVASSFRLSRTAIDRLSELKGRRVLAGGGGTAHTPEASDLTGSVPRDDPHLVQVVEELGAAAAGPNAELAVIEIPDGIAWKISEVAGYEFVSANGKVF
jgi:hypothetical protein